MEELQVNVHYRGLVDIGSNGVRFSITNLAPTSARIMPTLFQDRAPISLYDAQFSGTTKSPISNSVIEQLVTCMLRFKIICSEFGVPHKNVRVVATEATREAQNSAEFRGALEEATGWKVELLSKEDEGRIGAEGVASSFAEVRGLVMDLGGGSTQIIWMLSKDGVTKMAKKAVSFPYGAAAVTKKLETAINEDARSALHNQMVVNFKAAIASLDIPDELSDDIDNGGCVDNINHHSGGLRKEASYNLYLSGGGFRGFGYLLMAKHELKPYPIPIINGFTAPASHFARVAALHKDVNLTASLAPEMEQMFGISARRARQVPAVAFVIEALTEALHGALSNVIFCQGGVREGAIYEKLPPTIRAENPLVVATRPYAPPSQAKLLELLNNACPRSTPYHIRGGLLPPLANLMYYHSNVPKEGQASVALYATTTGVLANTHGLSHGLRALLGIALCDRWGGGVHASAGVLREGFVRLVGGEDAWWARYVGSVAALIGEVFPSGRMHGEEEQIRFFAQDDERKKKKKKEGKEEKIFSDGVVLPRVVSEGHAENATVLSGDGTDGERNHHVCGVEQPRIWLKVTVRKGDPMTSTLMFGKVVGGIEKVGKKKKMEGGWRRKVVVNISFIE
ncbi:Ppx-GppA-domain-containing protein [Terfezia boudieri ATCC MYA-4762]|uniref:Ppx-GppA-domain-containing protein n=1 Tax=Terfezia boudieri ATCC MYA-4762 TaxID=1051890 RepID=A0A3N4MM10_9PEZI|nr:Ppx-GppA-domain-containing protein [Terfezia boudieri ATCC MYA-4762]